MAAARRRTFATLGRLAEDGRFTLSMYEDLETHEFQLGGKGPIKIWGDMYRREMDILKGKVDTRIKTRVEC